MLNVCLKFRSIMNDGIIRMNSITREKEFHMNKIPLFILYIIFMRKIIFSIGMLVLVFFHLAVKRI